MKLRLTTTVEKEERIVLMAFVSYARQKRALCLPDMALFRLLNLTFQASFQCF